MKSIKPVATGTLTVYINAETRRAFKTLSLVLLFPVVLQAVQAAVYAPPTSGLVAWWRGEDNADDSANGHNGSLFDGVGFSSGAFDRAFVFAGNANKVFVPDSPDFQLTQSLTIGAWVYPTANSWTILQRGDSRAGTDPYTLTATTSGNWDFHITTSLGITVGVSTPMTLGRWQQVTATLDGATGDMKLYIDGTLAAQRQTDLRPFADLTASGAGIGIGNIPSGGEFPFIGKIDEVVLYSRAFTPQEVVLLVPEPSAVSLIALGAGIVLYWRRRIV